MAPVPMSVRVGWGFLTLTPKSMKTLFHLAHVAAEKLLKLKHIILFSLNHHKCCKKKTNPKTISVPTSGMAVIFTSALARQPTLKAHINREKKREVRQKGNRVRRDER